MKNPSSSENLMHADPTSQGSWLALLTVSISAFALVTSEFLPIGVLNNIATDFNISVGTAGLMITLPGIMAAFAAPLVSVWVKGLDRRYLLIALTAVMVVANFITALSESFNLLLFSRFILGIAIGGFWATAITLSPKLAPSHLSVAKAVATVMLGVTLASVLGVPIGTWLSEYWNWRIAFLATATIGLLILVAEFFFLPSLKPTTAIQLRDLPALLYETKARKGLIIILLLGLAHFSSYSYLAPFFKHIAGFDGVTISYLLILYGVAGIVGNSFAGYAGEINVRYTFASVCVSFIVVYFLFPTFAVTYSGAVIFTALWGFAFGAFPTTANIWMMIHAPQAVEKGMPLFIGIFQVMIAMGSFLGGYLVDTYGEITLLHVVLVFVVIALLSIFTVSRGLNNPKLSCDA